MNDETMEVSHRKVFREEIRNAIREAIFSGDLKPGDRIIETFWAKELGVSKACVSAWENGKRIPGGNHLIAYIKLFELEEDYFDDLLLSKNGNAGRCFDMSLLNVHGAKKMYDLYLSLLEKEEYLKKY